VQLWHRKPEWKLHAIGEKHNACIERVTPLENAAVNGPWICNVGRDLAREVFERSRAEYAMQKGKPVELSAAIDAARNLIDSAKRPLAFVSSWGSNEELGALKAALGARVECRVKTDWVAQAGERIEDDFLIRADKNPNTAAAMALFGQKDNGEPIDAMTDLVLVWGEGFDFARIPRNTRIVFLNSYLAPENGHADVFIPISVQTERCGHYTNFKGVVSAFEPCFSKSASIANAEAVFAKWTAAKASVAAEAVTA
jgi:NADH-quinone oxidoreductase subunit G